MTTFKKTIAIDFDGVLHRYSRGWQDGKLYDPPMPGSYDALARLAETCNLVVFTTRQDLTPVIYWLNAFFPGLSIRVTNVKPKAYVYIDDRGLRFTSWQDTLDQLVELDILEDDESVGIHRDVYPEHTNVLINCIAIPRQT
jgi:hypothetical protein